ncbi:hypothetical protein H4582DRAFT_1942316 [Lactarius indigo]|nr:hypothetical protein H4582DRAFT_1942316 [Lactarius indigo]
MNSPALALARPSSKTCSTSWVMIQAIDCSLHRVVPKACYPIWGTLGAASRHFHLITSRDLMIIHFMQSTLLVLPMNGISFATQAVLLLTIGGWADYGTWRWQGSCTKREGRVTVGPYRPNITIVFTLLAVGVSFA